MIQNPTTQFEKYHSSAHRNRSYLACAATADEHDLQRPVVHLGWDLYIRAAAAKQATWCNLMPLWKTTESIMLIQTFLSWKGTISCFDIQTYFSGVFFRRLEEWVRATSSRRLCPSTVTPLPRLRFALGQSFTELPLCALASALLRLRAGCEEMKVILLPLSVFS